MTIGAKEANVLPRVDPLSSTALGICKIGRQAVEMTQVYVL